MENKIKNTLSWIIKGLLFAVPFIPLYIAINLFFPFITGKAFVFRAIVEVVLALWILLAVFYKEYRPNKNALILAIGIFIAVVTLATVTGINPLKSFWSNFERMEGLVMYLHLFAYFLVLGNVFKKRDWFVLFNLFVVSGLLENGYALMQAMGKIPSPQGGFRVDGTIGNPTYLAAFLIFIVGFCIWLFIASKNKYLKTYYVFSGALTLIVIYLTASRGPVLGILLSIFTALIAYLIFKKSENDQVRRFKKIILGTLAGLFVVVTVLWGIRNVPFVTNNLTLSRLTNLSLSDGTISARFDIWKMSFEGFKERPILGWGPENYLAVFAKYYSPGMWMQEPWFDRSHNIIFDWLINAGIVGLLSYLSIFFFALRELYKNYKNGKIIFEEYLLIIGIFIAYFFQNLFVFDNIATYISFFAILAWIYSISAQDEKLKLENRQAEFDINYFPLMAAVVFATVFFYSYFITIKPFLENSSLIKALIYRNVPVTALDYYKEAFAQNTFLGRDETRVQFANLALTAARDQQMVADKKKEILELAIKEFDIAKEQNPMDPRPHMFESLLYDRIGYPEQAIQNMEDARKISPRKQDILINLAKLYLNQNDYDKAMPILLEAFNEDPAYTQPRIALAGAYILMGDQVRADQLLMDGLQTVDIADDFMVQVYSIVKKYDRLIGIWTAYVKKYPTNIGYYKALAGSYLLAGQKENAISVLKNIISIDSSLEKEANDYINQIRLGQI